MSRAQLDALDALGVLAGLDPAAAGVLREVALMAPANGQPLIVRRRVLAARAGVRLREVPGIVRRLEAAGVLRAERGPASRSHGRRFARYHVLPGTSS